MEPTPSQTVGPFFSIGLLREARNEVVPGGDVRIEGVVYDGAGEPVNDALLELWQDEGWGRAGTDEDGRYFFVTVAPRAGSATLLVFARGLLKQAVARIEFSASTRFDVRLQGDDQTVFFDV